METYVLKDRVDVREITAIAQNSDEPVIVYEGEDECLVAMRPAVFERILFDTHLLNAADRQSLHV